MSTKPGPNKTASPRILTQQQRWFGGTLTGNTSLPEPLWRRHPGLVSWSSECSKSQRTRAWLEQTLIKIWQQLLGREAVERHENFFEIGGHSLLATQLITRIRQQLRVDIPLYELFKAPTLAAQATLIETYTQVEQGCLVPDIQPMTRDILLPLSYAQQRIWHESQQIPESATYNLSTALRIRGQINARGLEHSLKEIVQRHEILRTVFLSVGEGLVQLVLTTMVPPLDLIDLTHIAPELQEQAVERFIQEHIHHPFNLAQGPLLRAHLLQLNADSSIFLLTLHQMVADGWSLGIFMRELATLYNAYITDQPAIVPPLAIQYGDFVAWQHKWMDTTVLQSQVQYWQKQLASVSEQLTLPIDHPRPATQTVAGAQQSFSIPIQLLQNLQQLSQREGITLYMTLLAAWQILLHSYSNQEQIAVGTSIANRGRGEIEDLIGPFDNTLLMLANLAGNPPCKDFLQQVKQVCLDAYTNQHVSLEQIAQEVRPEPTTGSAALFQVMFVLQNTFIASTPFQDLEIETMPLHTGITRCDLTLSLMETKQGLVGRLGYNGTLFEPTTISGIIANYQRLLESMVLDVTQPISSLIDGPTDQQQLANQSKDNILQEQESTYWRAMASQFSTELPIDYACGANTVESTETVTVALTPGETSVLLDTIQDVYRTQVSDILLTALALTLMLWRNQEAVTINIEHCKYPVHLDLADCHSLAQAIKCIKEQLRHLAAHGASCPQRRYLASDMANSEIIGPAQPTLNFSYLESAEWIKRDATEPTSDMVCPHIACYHSIHDQQGQRAYLLEISSLVIDGQMRFNWSYSRNCYDAETIQDLAAEFLHALREILHHCQEPQAGGLTPSDFPLAGLTQEQLDQRIDLPRQVEDIYPLTALQQERLSHSLSTSVEDSVIQVSMLFERGFDLFTFQDAWDQVIQNHAILRTGFLWEQLPEAQQVVYRDGFLPMIQQDWRHLTAEQQQQQLELYQQADLRQDFSLTQAPLMRLFSAQLSAEKYAVLWSYHHLLLDDWSRSLVLEQLFTAYQEGPRQRTPHIPRPDRETLYREGVRWQQQQDQHAAERFWRKTLQGIKKPMPLILGAAITAQGMPEPGYGELIRSLTTEQTQALTLLAQRQHTSLEALLQLAWALLLHHYSGENDIIFGVVTNGRPAALQESASMVGLLMNIIPLRMRVQSDLSIESCLWQLQQQRTASDPYAFSPLSQVQAWGKHPAGRRLFESLFVFEQYPTAEALIDTQTSDLARVRPHLQITERTGYPLTLLISPGKQLRMKLHYDRQRGSEQAMRDLLTYLEHIVLALLHRPAATIAQLCDCSDEEYQHIPSNLGEYIA